MYINTYGEIPVTLKISKNDKEFIYYEDLNGDYEGLEVDTLEEALEDIKGNIYNYYEGLNGRKHPLNNGMDDKVSYISEFAEKFNIDYTEAIENYYDIQIDIVDIDLSLLEIKKEEF